MEINYMSRLVDNLLDMSQIEAGSLIPQQEWHPLEDIVEGALRRMNFTTENRNLKVEIPEDIPRCMSMRRRCSKFSPTYWIMR